MTDVRGLIIAMVVVVTGCSAGPLSDREARLSREFKDSREWDKIEVIREMGHEGLLYPGMRREQVVRLLGPPDRDEPYYQPEEKTRTYVYGHTAGVLLATIDPVGVVQALEMCFEEGCPPELPKRFIFQRKVAAPGN